MIILVNADTQNLTDLITCILQRVGDDIDRNHLPLILVKLDILCIPVGFLSKDSMIFICS